MTKTINFEYWRLSIIDEKNNKLIPFKEVISHLESKPLDISKDNHRYYCKDKICNRAISHISKFNDGKLISFSKYDNQDIKGGYLEDGAYEFDAIQKLKESIKRDDIAIKAYNRIKIYNNGIAIFQVNGKANTMKQLKEYLAFHCENDYKIEIIQIYQNELFEEIDNGNIHNITLSVGFQPTGSFDQLEEENYSGALTAELKLKKGKDNFLKSTYVKSILFAKRLNGFGSLDMGIITGAKARIQNKNSTKMITVSLDQYQLKESKIFKETTFYDMNPNDTFDELYTKHKVFLEEYIKRDTRY